jgi:signal transduction histidine kinase
MALRVTWRDLVALCIAVAAIVASVALWDDGRVAIGLELREGVNEEDGRPGVFVARVTPDGNAAREKIGVGQRVLELTTVDGGSLEQGLPEFPSADGGLTGVPVEAVEPARIERVVVGEVYEDQSGEVLVYGYGWLERSWLESELRTDIYAVGIGILLGLVVGVLLWRGWLGDIGRRVALVAGSAAALPLLLVPVVKVGHAAGIQATYGALLAVSLLLAYGLTEHLARPMPLRAAIGAAVGAAGLSAALVVRHALTPELSPDEREPIAVLMAAVALAPALVAAFSERGGFRRRADYVTIGVIPGVASIAIMPSNVQPVLPAILIVGLLLVHGLPWERVTDQVNASFARVRSGAGSIGPAGDSVVRDRRDIVCIALVGATLFAALTQDAAWAIVLAGIAGMFVFVGVRQGILGPDWTDASLPLAASVMIPILLAPMSWGYSSGHPVIAVPTALTALAVAHLVSERHSDPAIGVRLFVTAALFATFIIATSLVGMELSIPLAGLIPLIPAIPVAFARRPEALAISWRLETLAVALTPLVATMVIGAGGAGVLILAGWVAALVIWRTVALNPLIGLARRTELQRDVAVAAAETERARLAADLHDDALQQLTMLVRTLDEGGHTEEADEAREIATKLRSVVGDLRLPILDDLGAGAALEWLVERVEPLAGGPVKLERSDEARPPANVELAVFRVAQEALTNAIKHGKPPIAVRYDVRTDGRVTLAIDDAGEGIGSEAADEAPKDGHFGLVNMQQRAEQIGALLDVRRWPAGGTRVALEWRPQ